MLTPGKSPRKPELGRGCVGRPQVEVSIAPMTRWSYPGRSGATKGASGVTFFWSKGLFFCVL